MEEKKVGIFNVGKSDIALIINKKKAQICPIKFFMHE
jgi:hypothetical protein